MSAIPFLISEGHVRQFVGVLVQGDYFFSGIEMRGNDLRLHFRPTIEILQLKI